MVEITPEEIAVKRIEEADPSITLELDLSKLNLTSLPKDVNKLKNLQILNLGQNNLSSLPVEICDLKKLTILDLGENKFQKFPEEVLEFRTLGELYLGTNLINSISDKLNYLNKLEIIDLSNNNIIELSQSLMLVTTLKKLHIFGNQIKHVPPEICNLRGLQSLLLGFIYFGGNNITFLPKEIGRLSNLADLYLSSNKLSSLPEEIKELKSLVNLGLDDNNIEAFPKEINLLTNLEYLDLRGNQIKYIPKEIAKLQRLVTLDLRRNAIEDIPIEISLLTNLETIYLTGNKIKKVRSEIFSLPKLKSLYLGKNQLRNLPNELAKANLQFLELLDNQLQIPPEILSKEDTPRIIIKYYLDYKKKSRRLNELKVAIIGQGSVGKTSLIQRILYDNFNPKQDKTEGIATNFWQIYNQFKDENQQSKINLNIWDFGGQEIMHATHQFFLTKRSLYVLVLDSRLTQEENRIEYWLKIIQSFGGESPVLIVGNKIDQHPLDIDRTGLQKKYPNIVGILETSAATGAGIEELKAAITEQANNLPHVRDLLPETWFTVKTKLEELGKQSNFISHDKYLELCAENEVSDETSQRTLIGFLHDLGVVLHFQDDRHLAELGILNPQWVTNGVYKILNDKGLFANKGVLTLSLLDEILSAKEYPSNKRLFIVEMMRKFELCYDIDRDNFLIPDLLPKDEPEFKFNGVPAFEYAYPVLPSSVITRFIVRMNQKIENHFVWRTGVVLKIGENKALVKADIEDRKITIAIDGLEHTRRDVLSAIRFQLDEIHGSIKGLDAQKRVPIPEAPNAEPLDYDYLLQLEQDGFEEHPVKNGKQLVKVNVKKLLSGIVSETERKQNMGHITNIYVGGDVTGGNIISGDENRASVETAKKKKTRKKKS
jgi:small GTP-binding protein